MERTSVKMRGGKSIFYLAIITVLTLFCANDTGAGITNHFWGDAGISGINTNNVYRTGNSYGDIGFDTDFNMGLRTKFSKYTFSRVSYQFRMKEFFTENIENNSTHTGDFLFKQRLGEAGVININAGAELMRFPNITFDKYQITQNSNRVFISPELKVYPTNSTSIGVSLDYDGVSFPDYDLDKIRMGYSGSIGQEVSIYTYIKIGGDLGNSDYSERYVYGISGITRTDTGELRVDTGNSWYVSLSQYIPVIKSDLLVTYRRSELASNGNYFDFGPEQWEDMEEGSIAGDERLVNNYYSYVKNMLNLSGKVSLGESFKVKFNLLYGSRKYQGRLAKDENDEFRDPDEFRSDTPLILSVELIEDMTEEFDIQFGNIEVGLRYNYENNKSNDYLYNYTASTISLFVRYFFSK